MYIIIIYNVYYVYYVYKQLSIHVIWNFVKFRQRMTRHVSATDDQLRGPSEATGTIPQLSCWTPEKPVCQWIGWKNLTGNPDPTITGWFFALPEKWWSFSNSWDDEIPIYDMESHNPFMETKPPTSH